MHHWNTFRSFERFGSFTGETCQTDGDLIPDYYKILGVSPDSTKSEIRKAFHVKARKNHPDKGGDNDSFKECRDAFNVLSDDSRRQEYDQRTPANAVVNRISLPIAALYKESTHVVPFQKKNGGVGSVSVVVPAGAANHMRVVTPVADAVGGRVVSVICYLPSSEFKISGRDITVEANLTLEQALCSVPFKIMRPDGAIISVCAHRGTVMSPSAIWEIPDHGIPSCQDYPRGSFYIKINIHFPMIIQSEQAEKILHALGGTRTEDGESCVTPVLADQTCAQFGASATNDAPCHVQ